MIESANAAVRGVRLRRSLALVLVLAGIFGGSAPVAAGESAGLAADLTAEERTLLETLRDAHKQFSVRPERGRVVATTWRSPGPVLGEERSEVEVSWTEEHYKAVVLTHTVHSEQQREQLQRKETRQRRTLIAGPDCRTIAFDMLDPKSHGLTVSRGAVPGVDPFVGHSIAWVEPDNCWYGMGGIGRGGGSKVDGLLSTLLEPDYAWPVEVTTTDDNIVEVQVGDDPGNGLTVRFDLTKDGRIVEYRRWSDQERTFARRVLFEWKPDPALGWRLGRKDFYRSDRVDAPPSEQHHEFVEIHECEFDIEFPNGFFACDQIATPDGTLIREYEPGNNKPVAEFIVGQESSDALSAERLRAMGAELKKKGFGSDEKKE